MASSSNAGAEADRLGALGKKQYLDGQLEEAVQTFLKQLQISDSLNNPKLQGNALGNLGYVYNLIGDKTKSLEYYNEAISQFKIIKDNIIVARILVRIATITANKGEPREALNIYNQALSLSKSINDQVGIATALLDIGSVYSDLSDKKRALKYYDKSLEVYRSLGDKDGESSVLNNIATIYYFLGDSHKALEYFEQNLIIFRASGDKQMIGDSLLGIGNTYSRLGEKQKALEYYEQAVTVHKSINDKRGEISALLCIGGIYSNLGKNEVALHYFEKSLYIGKSIDEKSKIVEALTNIGSIYNKLGESQTALEYYNKALTVYRMIDDLAGESIALNNIGTIYDKLDKKNEALVYYKKALIISKSVGDVPGEGDTLHNIGAVYLSMGETQEALRHYDQSMSIFKNTGDKAGQGSVLNEMGVIYDNLDEISTALDFYSRALTICKETGDRDQEAVVLENLGQAVAKQNRPELGIFFLKQSVNTSQSLRRDISGLPKSVQKTFANASAEPYRILAGLLLDQGRVLEAQQILDLLKIDEIDNYFRDNQRSKATAPDVAFTRAEAELSAQFGKFFKNAIEIGQEAKKLKLKARNGLVLSPEDQKKLTEYDQFLTKVNGKFIDFINSAEVQEKTAQLSKAKQQQIPLDLFVRLRKNLSKLGDAALVYPLIMDDRIELTITVADAPSLRRTVKIPQSELNQAILDFREALETPSIDPKPIAHKLYTWLIEPLEADLAQANIHTIIYAPDGPLRYVPLAALYDGKQWIAQRFAINNITAASITDLDPTKAEPLRVLAGAFADEKQSYKIQVGDQTPLTFHGLPYAGQEVNDIAKTIPNTDKRVDQAFSLKILKPLFDEYSILHFATHAAFFPARPEDSFILFWDGEQASLNSINDWTLNGVDLVVLSSCESGLGVDSSPYTPKSQSSKLGSGVEILGLGYQFQKSGAKATIASLWAVDDGGTQTLMSAFYKLLSKGNISKVEALRQAQVELITGQVKLEHKNLTHPRYWAPFFLIGNGL